MPQTLAAPAHSELLIKKSRFIGCVQPVRDRSEAQRQVSRLWAEHPLATHVCWALLAGGQSAAVDDGEPSGTAGRPMLDVLRHQNLESVLATVVRYYGGVNLGAGGLVRAYSNSVSQALLQAQKIDIVRWMELSCVAPYALEGLVRREVDQIGAKWLKITHNELVEFNFSLPEDTIERLVAHLNESSAGRIHWINDRV